jgi:hypothetical protein
MQTFIATISEPASPDVQFVEERRLIVLATSREAAEDAFREYAAQHHSGVIMGIKIEDERPSPSYVQQAELHPNVAKRYNP